MLCCTSANSASEALRCGGFQGGISAIADHHCLTEIEPEKHDRQAREG